MPDEWGSKNFGTGEGQIITGLNFSHTNDFYNAVAALPSSAKKAMYAAATSRTIKKSTWNGCAFNQAGLKLGYNNVSSIESAARAFKCSVAVVHRFIQRWDSMSGDNDYCTGILRETLESIGLFTEPGHNVRVVSSIVYRNEQNALTEAFKKELENTDFIPEGFQEAGELLFAS